MQPDNERRLTRAEAAAFLSERGFRVAYATLNKYATVGGGPIFQYIAAMRAKQLRKGALPRIDSDGPADIHRPQPYKAERIAMEEVRQGLVLYDLPKTSSSDEASS